MGGPGCDKPAGLVTRLIRLAHMIMDIFTAYSSLIFLVRIANFRNPRNYDKLRLGPQGEPLDQPVGGGPIDCDHNGF